MGWLRSHVLTIEGDHTHFGYGIVSPATYAYILNRVIAAAAPAATPSTPKVESAPTSATSPTTTPTPSVSPAPSVPTPAPVSVPVPATPVTPAPDPDATLPCIATVSASAGARLRQTPVTGAQVMIIPSGANATVMEARTISGETLRWIRLSYQGQEGWTREDLLSFSGSCAAFGLATTSTTPAVIQPTGAAATFPDYTSADLYPVPMARYRFVRGFQGPVPQHNGVDYGGDTGEAMLAGPVGGLCVASVECTRCNVPGKPSTILQGLGLANSSVFSDPAWNFGYGHYVIIRYLNNQLPPSTRQTLANMGFPGGHIFAMHAHLSRRDARAGEVVEARQVIGACGDTGNSQGSHLHLELRASRSPNYTSWAALGSGLLDPLLMFRR